MTKEEKKVTNIFVKGLEKSIKQCDIIEVKTTLKTIVNSTSFKFLKNAAK